MAVSYRVLRGNDGWVLSNGGLLLIDEVWVGGERGGCLVGLALAFSREGESLD